MTARLALLNPTHIDVLSGALPFHHHLHPNRIIVSSACQQPPRTTKLQLGNPAQANVNETSQGINAALSYRIWRCHPLAASMFAWYFVFQPTACSTVPVWDSPQTFHKGHYKAGVSEKKELSQGAYSAVWLDSQVPPTQATSFHIIPSCVVP